MLSSLAVASSKDTTPLQLNGIKLTLLPGMTLETIIAQIQKQTERHLYVINGEEVRYCSDLSLIKPLDPLSDIKTHDVAVHEPYMERYIYQGEECVCCMTSALRNKLLDISCLDIATPKDQLKPSLVQHVL